MNYIVMGFPKDLQAELKRKSALYNMYEKKAKQALAEHDGSAAAMYEHMANKLFDEIRYIKLGIN